ncbi:NAD(P)-dependent oxidoreductase [Microbacterium sp. NPDC089696]|uniref:NAD(P)-dependent oxidoreductase n=1 Tax=Microbacterium sp. NPDC089696 TaxID=3364199 RepID=UPI003812FBB9
MAEFALALTLASLRRLHEFARETSWSAKRGDSLFDQEVTVFGAGEIGREYIRLLQPFEPRVNAVRRSAEPVDGAARTVSPHRLEQLLPSTTVLMIAAASTGGTRGAIDAAMLDLLPRGAGVVNVARGDLLDHDALAHRLANGALGAAALDTTDPEPLPPEHALWREPRCLLTPHTANTDDLSSTYLDARIEENLQRWAAERSLLGRVDIDAGY